MTAVPSIPEPLVEYVPDSDDRPTVELLGRRFPIGDRPVPMLSLMKLATLAKRQQEREANGQASDQADEMESMVILYELVRSIIAVDAWAAFERHANTAGAGSDQLQSVIRQAVEVRAARPTQPSSGSPDGRSTTGPSSAGGSSAPGSYVQGDRRVQASLEARGRPDVALVVQRAREASTTS